MINQIHPLQPRDNIEAFLRNKFYELLVQLYVIDNGGFLKLCFTKIHTSKQVCVHFPEDVPNDEILKIKRIYLQLVFIDNLLTSLGFSAILLQITSKQSALN